MERRLNETHVGWIFLVSYLSGVLLTAWMTISGSKYQDDMGIFLLYVAAGQIGLNVLPAFLWCRYKRIQLKTAFNLHKVSLRVLVLSLLIYAVSQVILLFIHQLTELVSIAIDAPYETSHYPIADSVGRLLMLIVSIGIIPPICEELLFRGALLSGYANGRAWFAAGVTAALFALFHDNPYRLVELFAAAWVAAIIVLRAGSIYPGLLVHLLTNITYVSVSYVQGGDMLEGLSAPQGPDLKVVVLTGIASIFAFFLCRWLLMKVGSVKAAGGERPALHVRAVWIIPIALSAVIFIVKYLLLSKG